MMFSGAFVKGLFLRTPKYGAITRHFICEKQGCRYNGVSMNGESPNKAMEIDLYGGLPRENSGMRQYDLNIGGVRIVTFPLNVPQEDTGTSQDRFV